MLVCAFARAQKYTCVHERMFGNMFQSHVAKRNYVGINAYISHFADVPSRNHAGVNSKAIDAVIDNMIRADSHEAQVFYCQLLDRLLRVGYYMVPLGYKSSSDVAFWRCLAHPPLKTHFIPSIYAWWWVPGCKKQ